MSQKDGANYVVLYQMLCLKTVNNDGVMARKIGEMIVPYDIDKIQRDCKWFTIDTVRIALELYKKLGLIYENTDGIFTISNFDRMIGSQSIGAEKKELQKLGGGTKVEKIPPDKEIKRKRLRDKEKDIEKEKYTTTATTTAPRYADDRDELKAVGYEKVVVMTDRQYDDLYLRMGDTVDDYIARLEHYIVENNANVHNHYATILKWHTEDTKVEVTQK
jgi:hypothetical protein